MDFDLNEFLAQLDKAPAKSQSEAKAPAAAKAKTAEEKVEAEVVAGSKALAEALAPAKTTVAEAKAPPKTEAPAKAAVAEAKAPPKTAKAPPKTAPPKTAKAPPKAKAKAEAPFVSSAMPTGAALDALVKQIVPLMELPKVGQVLWAWTPCQMNTWQWVPVFVSKVSAEAKGTFRFNFMYDDGAPRSPSGNVYISEGLSTCTIKDLIGRFVVSVPRELRGVAWKDHEPKMTGERLEWYKIDTQRADDGSSPASLMVRGERVLKEPAMLAKPAKPLEESEESAEVQADLLDFFGGEDEDEIDAEFEDESEFDPDSLDGVEEDEEDDDDEEEEDEEEEEEEVDPFALFGL